MWSEVIINCLPILSAPCSYLKAGIIPKLPFISTILAIIPPATLSIRQIAVESEDMILLRIWQRPCRLEFQIGTALPIRWIISAFFGPRYGFFLVKLVHYVLFQPACVSVVRVYWKKKFGQGHVKFSLGIRTKEISARPRKTFASRSKSTELLAILRIVSKLLKSVVNIGAIVISVVL